MRLMCTILSAIPGLIAGVMVAGLVWWLGGGEIWAHFALFFTTGFVMAMGALIPDYIDWGEAREASKEQP